MPIVSGMGFVPTTILIAVILGLLTQFLHNMVLGLIFIPVFAQIALELGAVVPIIRLRDNIQLNPNQYIIKIKGIHENTIIVQEN